MFISIWDLAVPQTRHSGNSFSVGAYFNQIILNSTRDASTEWLYFYNDYIFFLQNEYIKYPVLYELSHKYLHDNQPESNLPDRLEELKEAIRKEIRKELKVRREGQKVKAPGSITK